jgi:hypothetical protein
MSWIGAGALAVAAGTTAYSAYNASKNKGNKSANPTPFLPQNIKVDKGLAGSFNTIGQGGYNSINSTYSNANARTQGENGIKGAIAPSSYANERYGVQQGLDQGSLQSALGGPLAATTYSGALSSRNFDQNLGLTNQIAQANRPSTLDEILSGVGTGAQALSAYYGIRGRQGKQYSDPSGQNENVYNGNSGAATQPGYYE